MLEHIEEERGRKEMSQEALSQELGITSRTYRNYLASGVLPSDKLVHMARLFECSTDYLLGLTDRRTPA